MGVGSDDGDGAAESGDAAALFPCPLGSSATALNEQGPCALCRCAASLAGSRRQVERFKPDLDALDSGLSIEAMRVRGHPYTRRPTSFGRWACFGVFAL